MIRALLCALGLFAGTAQAECRLSLAVALDVSSSVDAEEDALQRNGLAAALIAPEVTSAFLAGDGSVALAVYEWSGRYNQSIILDWIVIRSRDDLAKAANIVAQSRRGHDDFPTAMGYALGYGAGLLQRGPSCGFKTLDIAGDGENNEGFGPAEAYAAFPFDGVTVNGLVVESAGNTAPQGLVSFYRSEVIRGPGAFIEVADGFNDYTRAMRRKLEREVRPPVFGHRKRPGTQG